MAHSTVPPGETARLVKELIEMFSNSYRKRDQLQILILDIESAGRLFSKLPDMIVKYENQGKKIDEQIHFLAQLQKFKTLVDENIDKSTQNHQTVLIIDDYLSSIQEGYKLFRNYGQSLEEINKRIEKQIANGFNKSKIGNLIIRGIETKLPTLICFDQKNSTDNATKSKIIKEFYGYFVKYVTYVIESLEQAVHDTNYRSTLEGLQSTLLNTQPLDIKDYFTKIKVKLIGDRGYSTEILLEYLAKNPIVHISVSNNSGFYCTTFIEIFQKPCPKKCIESLSILVYKLNNENFINLNKQIFHQDPVFKSIYDKGIELYLTESRIISTADVDRTTNSFKATASKNLIQLRNKFENLFANISSDKSVLKKLRDLIIDDKNSIGTFNLLTHIYGQRIKNLDFSDDLINVKYCFNYHFFKSLKYHDLDDDFGFQVFYQLLFYIHTCADRDTLTYKDDNEHKALLLSVRQRFSSVYNDDNNNNFNDLVEMFKVMIDIHSFEFRLKCVNTVMSELEKDDKLNVKIKVLKIFLDEQTYGSEICLRLAQSFNIHLIKYTDDDKKKILARLCGYNSNFDSVIKHLTKLHIEFDIDRELTPGFSIPYYLSAKLLDDARYNTQNGNSEENKQIVMSILFKVFTCSTDSDKEEFLRNKNGINQEFGKLFQSVNRLIEFYSKDSSNAISKKLRDESIQYILNGFSGANEESLTDRNEFARTIIDNFINYKLEQITKIVQSTKSDKEVFDLFHIIMKRSVHDSLHQWTENTSKLGDKIYFLYCYHRYLETEFDQWYQEMNSNLSYKIVEENRNTIKQEFQTNSKAFDLINIKYLQHNQVGALALIHDHLKDPLKKKDNLFIKIGTGQGKSLTIAETARKIIQKNKKALEPTQKVFVITCYDHLAKRDHENYDKYYKYFDIKSMYCSLESSPKDFYDKDVIYADLETYFRVLRKEGQNALIYGTSIDLPNISNAVLIMDEFDSLILDSDEIMQHLHSFNVTIPNQKASFDKKQDIEQLFDKKLIEQCNTKFSHIFDRWWKNILDKKQKEDRDEHAKTFQDSLGKDSRFGQSFLNYLKAKKKIHYVHFYLDALVFYSQFTQVIGFSGSITADGMNKFRRLFGDKQSYYYEIPPFFGPTNLELNRTFENKPGKVIENTDDFLKAIKDEVQRRYLTQPILIFADSCKRANEDKSDYDYIYDKLSEATFLKDCTMIKIQNEEDIGKRIHQIGKLGSITIATRIISRGADIKVDKSVEKGLHLILTYYPKRENIYIQMLGRTARQDEKGSYSVIARQEKDFSEVHETTVNIRNKKIHETFEYFYRHYRPSSNNTNVATKWALFSSLILDFDQNEIKQYDLEDFIKREIL